LERCFIFSNVGKNLHKVVTSTINHTFKQTGISTNENTTIIKNSSTQYSFKYVSNLMNSFYQPSKSQKTTGQQFFSVLTFTAKLTCFW